MSSATSLRPLFLSILLLLLMTARASADATQMLPETAEHFTLADANADDGLDAEEFKAFVELEAEDDIGASRRIQSMQIYDRAFRRMDRNEDGLLSRDEIGLAQSRL